jgi:hypothetical protein
MVLKNIYALSVMKKAAWDAEEINRPLETLSQFFSLANTRGISRKRLTATPA